MSWIVKRIQEDDFGCEERPDDARSGAADPCGG